MVAIGMSMALQHAFNGEAKYDNLNSQNTRSFDKNFNSN